jgi:poly-gamma-glutamate capsule biosynthesis protein CapA/YwtB (metallophosphatase superfamily)
MRIFLCGDVMTGRGIDQILPSPCPPQLYEPRTNSALTYVRLAERINGPIARGVPPGYIWGAALEELGRARPDLRIVNLETAITRSDAHFPKKINYRMSPENADCLRAAGIDCCVLANNHTLDWGEAGLIETLATLERLQIKSVGAGRDSHQATTPAVFDTGKGRLIVHALASTTSGTPESWAGGENTAGLNVLTEFSEAAVARIAEETAKLKRSGDIAMVSIHWGTNWGYDVPEAQRRFAHALIDRAGVSIVHGHSSHHPKSIEVYRNRLVLYGCGDFLNDYEGISGYEEFRGDLPLMYFADVDPANGHLTRLEMVPLQIRRFQLVPPSEAARVWLQQRLDRVCAPLDVRVMLSPSGRFTLSWPGCPPREAIA